MKNQRKSDIQEEHAELRKDWPILGLIFFGLYAVATFSPQGATWGLHSLGYFPAEIQIAGLAICLGLLYPPLQRKVFSALRSILQPFLQRSRGGSFLFLVLGSITFILFYNFPIQTDIYGDSRNMLVWHADNTKLQAEWFTHIFAPNLFASKEALTVALHRTVSHVFAVPIGEAYRAISALSGALCLVLWLLFLRRDFASSRWGALLFVTGCFLGSHQLFFGHVENYPFPFLMSVSFLFAGFLMVEGKMSFRVVLLLFFLAVKAHATAILFFPAFLILIAWRLREKYPSIQRFLNWQRITFFLIIPTLVAGGLLYFFYFKSYNEPHAAVGRQFEHTFLPILPAPPPLDKYSLQSVNHLIDLGNVLLLVGTPLVIPLLGIVVFHRRAIDWRHPRVVFSTLAVLYPLIFFAAVNPELAMPRDWDLYALFGAPLLLFFAAILAHSDQRIPPAPVYGTTLAFAVFSVGFYVVNALPSRLSLRIEDIGEHVYKTYYAGASYIIAVGQRMEKDPAKALQRRIATVNRLAPVVVGEDNQYTHLLVNIASTYAQQRDNTNAILWMERATKIARNDIALSLGLSQLYLSVQQTEKAIRFLDALLQRDPRNSEGLKQRAVAAAQQQDIAGALRYLERAGIVAPQDPEIPAWKEQIMNMQTQQRKK